MTFPTARHAGTELCEILGLDANKTREIEIRFCPDRLVEVTAKVLPDAEDWERIKGVMMTVTRTYQQVGEQDAS
jgi:hypothetical protein